MGARDRLPECVIFWMQLLVLRALGREASVPSHRLVAYMPMPPVWAFTVAVTVGITVPAAPQKYLQTTNAHNRNQTHTHTQQAHHTHRHT